MNKKHKNSVTDNKRTSAQIFQQKAQLEHELYDSESAKHDQRTLDVLTLLDKLLITTDTIEASVNFISSNSGAILRGVNRDKFSLSSMIFGIVVGCMMTALTWIILKAPLCP